MNQTQNIVEFTLIYNKYKTRLYNYAIKMVYNRMVCDDIIQNTFIKFFENMDKIRNIDSVQYWLFTTARNEIFSYFRSKKINVDKLNLDDSDGIEIVSENKIDYDFEQTELRELIMNELNKMSIEQKDAYLLKEYGGFSYKEISGLMGIEQDLVKSRLYKIRQRLIKKLSPLLT